MVEAEDLEGVLVRYVHHPVRRHSDGRYRPKHSRRREGRLWVEGTKIIEGSDGGELHSRKGRGVLLWNNNLKISKFIHFLSTGKRIFEWDTFTLKLRAIHTI